MHDDSKLEKLIVFAIANYDLALPIDQVLRVINYPLDTSKSLEKIGLIQCGRHTIRAVNLSQQLQLETPDAQPLPFLMLVRGIDQELCGIPVSAPPDVIEISIEALQPLEWTSTTSPLLKVVSHTAVVKQTDETLSILLLDLYQVLADSTQKLLGASIA
ncbi:chemotaxis protein CheW [Leptolyngbya sp. FACHB-541]|uniref:chemotaxis protein CheW n=1 Tax=Leptolyngbya sp. FACHB-541 TaxID=2692810 RepID=UPI0016847E7F|nr:chemotaxis protein CheW [Leptolyngbya sp. FACHB-541]MBD1865864.1 chemotaxis protein CheW [Cyanobacteria bacterium FACHB-471]MBD1996354.1 chemotaxis protein CheW [Leptolyngbya sp. FACHB-541]